MTGKNTLQSYLAVFASLLLLGGLAGCSGSGQAGKAPEAAEQEQHVFVEGAAWTWFNDERARFAGSHLYIGYVDTSGYSSVAAVAIDSAFSDEARTYRLSSFQQVDDHNNPALLPLADGRTLAAYAHHGDESFWNWRFENANPRQIRWSPEQRTKDLGDGVTYSNLFQLTGEEGRIYNFFRGLNYDPTLMRSSDGGQTWDAPLHFLQSGDGETRPYVKYASNGRDRIDLLYTQAHPRQEENNVYHLYYQGGRLHESDGTTICQVESAGCLPVPVTAGTLVYDADEAGRAWVWDLEYAEEGAPVGVYVAARDSSVGNDLRYRYARFDPDAGQWKEAEIAYAGTHLYEDERHYAGGITLAPDDPGTVYLSADVNPASGASNEGVVYQIYRGRREDRQRWVWQQLTQTGEDNVRPFVPRGGAGHEAVLWLRGRYTTYTNYATDVVGILR